MILRKACLLLLGIALPLAAQGPLAYPDILYYKFNGGSGSAVTNSAAPGGSTYVPTWENGTGAMWDTSSPIGSGSAMDFAGITRLMSNYPTDLTGSFTIECWIKVNNPTTPGCGLNGCSLERLWGDYTGGMGLFRCYIGFYNEGANFLGGGLPSLNNTVNPAAYTVTDGNWHHIALVHDATGMTLTSYVDGNLDVQAMTTAPGNMVVGANFHLGGQQSTGAPFDGVVDEFRWWGEARSQATILANMSTELFLPIQASFSASQTTGNAPLLVSFTDTSTTTDPGGITSWSWTFGDGGTSTQQSPCYVYSTPGTFDVSLTVTSGAGTDTQTVLGYITVNNPDFSFSSCGQGDLYVGAPPPPAGWQDGYTLLSTTISGPVGQGWFFGLYPDNNTWQGLFHPAQPGNPLHFVNNGDPLIYPTSALVFPPGTFPGLAGTSIDALVIYRDAGLNLIGISQVSRVTF